MSGSVYERACDGAYGNKDAYPERPKKPACLSKRVSDLTPDEIAVLHKTMAAFEESRAAYVLAIEAWHKKDNTLGEQLEPDLAAEHRLLNNPKRAKLFELAWSQGHSDGHAQVALHYSELAELLDADKQREPA